MDERERRRLLRALIGQELESTPDPAVAISEAIRTAWHAAVYETAGLIERRLEAILTGWSYEPGDAEHAADLNIHTADEPIRARVAHVVTISERVNTERRRAARFVAGYELVTKGDSLAFDVQITPTEFGRVLDIPASAIKRASA